MASVALPQLPAAIAHDCLIGLYEENRSARGQWLVQPEKVQTPALVIIPEDDRIVPPASAWGLANALPRAEPLSVPLGHIGMVVSRDAPELVWGPLLGWLR